MLDFVETVIKWYFVVGAVITTYYTLLLIVGVMLKNSEQIAIYQSSKGAYLQLLKEWKVEQYSLASYFILVISITVTVLFSIITWPADFISKAV